MLVAACISQMTDYCQCSREAQLRRKVFWDIPPAEFVAKPPAIQSGAWLGNIPTGHPYGQDIARPKGRQPRKPSDLTPRSVGVGRRYLMEYRAFRYDDLLAGRRKPAPHDDSIDARPVINQYFTEVCPNGEVRAVSDPFGRRPPRYRECYLRAILARLRDLLHA